MRITLVTALMMLFASGSTAQPNDAHQPSAATNSVAAPARPAAAVVDSFHAALRRGDTKGALGALADNALIFESGGAERSKAEYASHHVGADAAFARAVPGERTRRTGEAAGNVAWIATEGRTKGSYKGRSIDEVTTETVVLHRAGKVWKIVHIHWSSAKGGK